MDLCTVRVHLARITLLLVFHKGIRLKRLIGISAEIARIGNWLAGAFLIWQEPTGNIYYTKYLLNV